MMMSRPIASILVALLALGALPAIGNGQAATRAVPRQQTSALMTPGAHVRVKLPGEHVWEGTIVSLADDSMLVRSPSGADTTLVTLSQVSGLEVSAGRRPSRHLVRNAAIGVVVGSGLGLLVGSGMVSGGCSKGEYCWEHAVQFYYEGGRNPPVTDRATAGTVVGGLVGGTLGLLVSRVRREDWRPVSVPPRRTAVTLSPSGGKVAIRF
jgi:hypothetical protein